MRDPRLSQLARLMLTHSLKLRPGEAYQITADVVAVPLVKAILEETRQIGALACVEWINPEISRQILELYRTDDGGATEAFLADQAACGVRQFQNLVANLVIRASANDQELSQIDPAVRRLEAVAAKPFKDLVINHRRWVLFDYPTPGRAQKAGLPSDRYADFVFGVSTLDYAAMQRQVQPLCDLMARTDRVRIIGPGTDLHFSIRGIPAIPCCGEFNLPDGECFTAPVIDSVNGQISFNTPSLYWGHTFSGVHFTFDKGRIVAAEADQNGHRLAQILDADAGARSVGEFALGFNPLIREPFCNTLFDEKIAGSFHLTPGACYDEAPNGNESAIHWDLVSIQRPEYGGGEIWFDDVLVRKDGLFTLPELAALNP
jgi:aminopeptidase